MGGGLYDVCIRDSNVSEEGGDEKSGTQNLYLYCHTHLDTSVSRTWGDSASEGCDNRYTYVHE